MPFNIRESIINRPMKTEDIATPFWSQKDENDQELVDGHLAFRDIPGNEMQAVQIALQKEPTKLIAALLCKALINKDTGERVFADTDRDVVGGLGGSILNTLVDPLQAFLGLNTKAVEDAKKNFLQNLQNGTGTPSQSGSSTTASK